MRKMTMSTKCGNCRYESSNPNSMRSHKRRKHPRCAESYLEVISRTCRPCNRMFSTSSNLKRHESQVHYRLKRVRKSNVLFNWFLSMQRNPILLTTYSWKAYLVQRREYQLQLKWVKLYKKHGVLPLAMRSRYYCHYFFFSSLSSIFQSWNMLAKMFWLIYVVA